MNEIWKTIPEAPDYQISNLGRVKSNKFNYRSRILKQKTGKTGYKMIGLCIKPKRKFFLVHRLVLSTFKPVENMNELEINHKDEDKSNNSLTNLEWVTSKENCNYGNRNKKLSDSFSIPVRCIETGIIYKSGREAGRLTNTSITGISNCLTGKRERAGGFHWEVAI